eukprot:459594-Pleurochrysis_carterae.AAC.2
MQSERAVKIRSLYAPRRPWPLTMKKGPQEGRGEGGSEAATPLAEHVGVRDPPRGDERESELRQSE